VSPLLMFAAVPALSALTLRFGPRVWAAPALALAAFVHLLLTLLLAIEGPAMPSASYFVGRYFVLDPTSLLFLLLVNLVFSGIAVYMWSRVRSEPVLEQDMPTVAGLALMFMAAINAAILSNHLILMWAFIEVTTLAAAPLVARGEHGARRAAWRYLLFSTVSLSLSFLGFLCLAQSAHQRGVELGFFVDQLPLGLSAHGDLWQRLGLSLMLFGFGSKLGLAPLYGWLPQTYDLAPPSVTAMLAAVQFNASIVAVFRIFQIFRTDDVSFVAQELLVMGTLSLLVAAVQIMAAHNYKRLLAHACVSSSGVIAIGLGVGRKAAYGVVLYVVSNAFVKTILFLTAGRLKAVYGSKEVSVLSGVIKRMPFAGLLFTVGTFALLGFPPFGSFMAEMLILSGIVQSGHLMVFTVLCTMLTIVFVATGRALFPMLWGTPTGDESTSESLPSAAVKLLFVAALISLGVYTPEPAAKLLRLVAASIGGS
jgi:hydrogenase-4 component F